jgi:iron complex outermembrane receptor protein
MFKKTTLNERPVLALAATSALAQEAQKLERIEITGSSIKRIDAETAVPLTVVTRESIDKSGASNVQELVDRLSSNNGGGRSLGESIGDSNATGQTGASLRGLGRERTLVLLNGRRLAIYPFAGAGVDLNAIPWPPSSASRSCATVPRRLRLRRHRRRHQLHHPQGLPRWRGHGRLRAAPAHRRQDRVGAGRHRLRRPGQGQVQHPGTFSFQEYDVIHAADRDFAKTGNRPDLGVVKSSGNTFPANAYNAQTGAYIPGVAGFPNCAPPDSFTGARTAATTTPARSTSCRPPTAWAACCAARRN